MFSKRKFWVLALVGAMTLPISVSFSGGRQDRDDGDDQDGGGHRVIGTWLCMAHRSDTTSPHDRPVMITLNENGTVFVAASTNSHTTPTSSVFSRGTAQGEWEKIGKNQYEYRSEALTYNAFGNAAGRQSVDSKLTYHPDSDQLTLSTVVDNRTFIFDDSTPDAIPNQGINGKITGETPPIHSLAGGSCNRFSNGFPSPGL